MSESGVVDAFILPGPSPAAIFGQARTPPRTAEKERKNLEKMRAEILQEEKKVSIKTKKMTLEQLQKMARDLGLVATGTRKEIKKRIKLKKKMQKLGIS